jgi:glyoxylase-like metal-dependent hydrolase (beta-lactamase superfamily II)
MPVAHAPPFHRIRVPTPYPVGPTNCYVITAEPVTLIDPGPNTLAAENALKLGLAGLGLVPEQVGRVVITHGHPDHYGLAPMLRARAGAEVLVGEQDLAKLTQDSSVRMATGRLLLRAGVPMEKLVEMGRGGEQAARDNLHPQIEGAIPVRGGERLAFQGGFELEILHLPGHTAGHICPFHRPSGLLFSGDTLILHITPNPLIEPDPLDPSERRRSLLEYMATLDVLAEMTLSTVYPGHGEPIEDPTGLIRDMRRHHRERTDDLAGRLGERPKTAWELSQELFPSLQAFDNFLAVSEVVAHMDVLVEEGRALEVAEGGISGYVRA